MENETLNYLELSSLVGLANFFGHITPEEAGLHYAEIAKGIEAQSVERKLRDLLWATHACPGKYCDDGELQCGCFLPTIDFLRDIPEEIERKIPIHYAQLAKAQPEISFEAGKKEERERIIRILETFGINDRTYYGMWQALKGETPE